MRRPTGNGSAKSELLSQWRRASSSPKGGRRREGIRPVGDLPEFGYSRKEISLYRAGGERGPSWRAAFPFKVWSVDSSTGLS